MAASSSASAPSTDSDKYYSYDPKAHNEICSKRPWREDPHYFKECKISAMAVIKMIMHATRGGDLEVMGLFQGKVEDRTFVVTDSFPLPVEGTETRVNAGNDANEYIIDFLETSKLGGRAENAVGWYHSHPGYGCWLSGIDVSTQMLYQSFQEPWLAIVVDPKKTIASGRVELGAFRTYPKDYKPPEQTGDGFQAVPLDKLEDFGAHAFSYYPLKVSYFRSSLDESLLNLLWNKYWINALSASPIVANRDYTAKNVTDLAQKLEMAETQLAHGRAASFFVADSKKKQEESQLAKTSREALTVTSEQVHGLMSEIMKDMLFNVRPGSKDAAAAAAAGCKH